MERPIRLWSSFGFSRFFRSRTISFGGWFFFFFHFLARSVVLRHLFLEGEIRANEFMENWTKMEWYLFWKEKFDSVNSYKKGFKVYIIKMNELRFQYFCISLQKYSNEVFHFPFLLFFTNNTIFLSIYRHQNISKSSSETIIELKQKFSLSLSPLKINTPQV